VPHIKAHWLFMLLSLVMVLLTITLVAMVSLQNRRKDVPLWKTSARADLHGGGERLEDESLNKEDSLIE
jgi:hypothetical protein